MKAWERQLGNATIVALLSFFTQMAVAQTFPPTPQMIWSSVLMFAITFLTLCKNIFGGDSGKDKERNERTRKALAKGQKTLGRFKDKLSSIFNRDECDNNHGGGFMVNLWL
jgi:uncharacterized membrane protein